MEWTAPRTQQASVDLDQHAAADSVVLAVASTYEGDVAFVVAAVAVDAVDDAVVPWHRRVPSIGHDNAFDRGSPLERSGSPWVGIRSQDTSCMGSPWVEERDVRPRDDVAGVAEGLDVRVARVRYRTYREAGRAENGQAGMPYSEGTCGDVGAARAGEHAGEREDGVDERGLEREDDDDEVVVVVEEVGTQSDCGGCGWRWRWRSHWWWLLRDRSTT